MDSYTSEANDQNYDGNGFYSSPSPLTGSYTRNDAFEFPHSSYPLMDSRNSKPFWERVTIDTNSTPFWERVTIDTNSTICDSEKFPVDMKVFPKVEKGFFLKPDINGVHKWTAFRRNHFQVSAEISFAVHNSPLYLAIGEEMHFIESFQCSVRVVAPPSFPSLKLYTTVQSSTISHTDIEPIRFDPKNKSRVVFRRLQFNQSTPSRVVSDKFFNLELTVNAVSNGQLIKVAQCFSKNLVVLSGTPGQYKKKSVSSSPYSLPNRFSLSVPSIDTHHKKQMLSTGKRSSLQSARIWRSMDRELPSLAAESPLLNSAVSDMFSTSSFDSFTSGSDSLTAFSPFMTPTTKDMFADMKSAPNNHMPLPFPPAIALSNSWSSSHSKSVMLTPASSPNPDFISEASMDTASLENFFF